MAYSLILNICQFYRWKHYFYYLPCFNISALEYEYLVTFTCINSLSIYVLRSLLIFYEYVY